MYDIVIHGAGPAGCAAAISLARLDPALGICITQQRPSYTIGQTLAPGLRRLFQQLGCWESFTEQLFIKSYSTRACWGSDEAYDHDFLFGMEGIGWHADRGRFDAWFRSCLPASVDVVSGTAPRARFVIDASGRSAVHATKAGAKWCVMDALVGVGTLGPGDATAGALVEAVEDGWWYSAPTGGQVMTAFFTDAAVVRADRLRMAPAWQNHLERTRFVKARLTGPGGARLRIWPAASQMLDRVHGEDWVACGDAASVFDPLSSAGVVKAVRSAMLASFAALDWLRGRTQSVARYASLIASEFRTYRIARHYYYGLERRWPASPFWAARHIE